MHAPKLTERFVLAIDINTMQVTGWPKPTRLWPGVIAVSGVVVENGRPSRRNPSVVASFYRELGDGFSAELLGQYCAVVVDVAAQRIILAQDSFGVRDLFYLQDGPTLLIASDLDLIVATRPQLDLDERFFAQFIGTMNPPRTRTPFKGVSRLTHGWTLVFSPDGVSRFRAWSPPKWGDQSLLDSDTNPEERLRELLADAVAASLPDKGVVFCELTGGLDSSSVFSTAQPVYDQIHAITYVADRGLIGDDELFAAEVLRRYKAPWHRLDLDTDECLPGDYGGFIAEPRAILYIYQFIEIERCLRNNAAEVLLTGSLGDVIFDYAGITPAFLADSLARGKLLSAYRLAQDWAAARNNVRSWNHYLLQIGWPLAWRHLLGRSVLDYQKDRIPLWLSPELSARYGLADAETHRLAPKVAEPGRQHLWESVYDLAAHENTALYRRLPADVRHPLYHRPLVEFLLGLDFRIRRGIVGDRKLQREALADRLPDVIRTRRSKGSAQELRERHLMESARWYDAMTHHPRIVERGWVLPDRWRSQVDQARVGALNFSPNFLNAVQAELWLRALEQTPHPDPVQLRA